MIRPPPVILHIAVTALLSNVALSANMIAPLPAWVAALVGAANLWALWRVWRAWR